MCILVFSIPPPFPPFHPSRSELRRRFTHVDQLSGNGLGKHCVPVVRSICQRPQDTDPTVRGNSGRVHLRRESRSQSVKKEGPPSARCGARLLGRDHRLDSDPPVHTSNVGGRRTPLRSLPDSCKGRWTTPAASLGTTLTTRSRPFPRRGSLLGSVSTGFLRSVAWVCASSS